jgi:hypothetical protein
MKYNDYYKPSRNFFNRLKDLHSGVIAPFPEKRTKFGEAGGERARWVHCLKF